MGPEKFHPSDDTWSEFVSTHLNNPLSGERYFGNESGFLFLGSLHHESVEFLIIAVSLFGVDGALDWLNKKIPALANKTPLHCIKESQTSQEMVKRFRQYLMQVPV